MNRTVAILICLSAAMLFTPDDIHGQSRSIGATFSYAGTGVEYALDVDEGNFAEFQLRMETAEMFRRAGSLPGISASAFWNIIFSKFKSSNGNPIRFYAGPGITLGYDADLQSPHGLIFGVKGRIGGECAFPRGISISMNISPAVGGHFGVTDGMVNMRVYRNGLLQILMPEASIRYRF